MKTYFDYFLQVWVRDGMVQPCGHKAEKCGCNARKYKGLSIDIALERYNRNVPEVERVKNEGRF